MIPKRITGANHWLGAPVNWRPDVDGDCGHLAIRTSGDPRRGRGWCESAWEPTPDELAALNAGGSIILRIVGWQPAVAIYVEPPSEAGRPAPVGEPTQMPDARASTVCYRCEEPISAILAFCQNADCPVRPLLRGERT